MAAAIQEYLSATDQEKEAFHAQGFQRLEEDLVLMPSGRRLACGTQVQSIRTMNDDFICLLKMYTETPTPDAESVPGVLPPLHKLNPASPIYAAASYFCHSSTISHEGVRKVGLPRTY